MNHSPHYSVTVTASIAAPAEKVYAVLADYHHARPGILPRPYFADLVLEAGGRGSGTVFGLRRCLWKRARRLRVFVTEPVPGRVLAETDLNTGQRLSFRLEPLAAAGWTQVTAAMTLRARPGLGGWLERRLKTLIARDLMRRMLGQLRQWLAAEAVWESELQAGLLDGRTVQSLRAPGG
jgi:hypothetical protein